MKQFVWYSFPMAWQAWLAPYTPFPHVTQIPGWRQVGLMLFKKKTPPGCEPETSSLAADVVSERDKKVKNDQTAKGYKR